MPSDPRVLRALDTLAHPIERYRTALATALEQVRGYLGARRSDVAARAASLEEQLGPLAGGRIDASRLARVLGEREVLAPSALERLERAFDVLRNLAARGGDLFEVAVPLGADAAASVTAQFAVIGRAFAAARVATAACAGGASDLDEAAALDSFPFSEWSTTERSLAPPVIVTLHGRDLLAGAFAPLLDGRQKLLLIVEGPCAPAPLVRLITPGTLVVQAHDFEELQILDRWRGAAVGALVPDSAVRFVHDPAAGSEAWQRISVQAAGEPRAARVGGLSAAQQQEELRQLQALATRPSALAEPMGSPRPAADPIDRLAAWLLEQARLPVAASGD
jgi:hypothetical protein